jgi:hypothetical protein
LAAFRTVLPLPGPVTAVTPGQNGDVYASYLPHPNGDRQIIVRFDPTTGGFQRSPLLAGGQGGVDRLAEAGGSLWASTASSSHPGRVLYRLNAKTLEIRERLAMPGLDRSSRGDLRRSVGGCREQDLARRPQSGEVTAWRGE